MALRYFVAVAEHGSYLKAASAMRLTQPAVSRQIRFLESCYKTRLVRREGRRFEVTEAGARLLIEARAILARVDALEHTIGIAAKEPSGVLSIGLTWATWESLLPQVLARFRARYPLVSLRITQDNPDRLANALAAHRIEIAVLNHRPRDSELDFLPLTVTESGLLVPQSGALSPAGSLDARHSIALSRALRLPLILPQRGRSLRDLIEGHGVRLKISPKVVMESDSLPLTKSLVSAGHGYTIVSLASVDEDVSRGEFRFIPIRSPSILWHLYAATAKQRSQTLAHKAMMQELIDFMR